MEVRECAFLLNQPLTIERVKELFDNPKDYNFVTKAAVNAKGGEVYIFKPECTEKQDDWRADQYRWRNNGVTALPKANPLILKSYFVLDTKEGLNNNFKRHAYQQLDKSNLTTIIHYIGDEALAVAFSHRSRTKSSLVHLRTCPSYFAKCAEKCKTMKPGSLYKQEISQQNSGSQDTVTELPRNLKQFQNMRVQFLSQNRISKDEIYNLHEVAFDIDNQFVRKVITLPNLICVCGLQEILGEADKAILLNETGQLLSYDTTFMLGDFYVSLLLFRHTIFVENPAIPALFLIHQKKLFETHQVLFQEAVKAIPSLKNSTCCLVTDKEQAIIKAVESELPKITRLQCWNHIFRDIRFWLRKKKAPVQEIVVYLDDICQMFHSSTKDEYNERLEEYSKTWDSTFYHYYMKEIHPDSHHVGRWVLQPLSLYNPYSGVTNNQSESFNKVIKEFQSWKEAPLDSFVLAMYQLQVYYSNEIKRGLAGLGQFHLKPEYKKVQIPSEEVLIADTPMPDYIVQSIKARQSDDMVECKYVSSITEQNTTKVSDRSSILSRAQDIIINNKITFNAQMHVFNVEGTNGTVRVVTLHPKETCSCLASGMCYHIMAARLSLGIKENSTTDKSRSFTQLYKSGKGKGKKTSKSGRKRPRIGDKEVPVLMEDKEVLIDEEKIYSEDENDCNLITDPTETHKSLGKEASKSTTKHPRIGDEEVAMLTGGKEILIGEEEMCNEDEDDRNLITDPTEKHTTGSLGQKSKMRANDDGGNGSTTGKIKPNAHLLTAIDNKTEVEPATIKAKSDLTTTANAKAKPETTSNDETMKAESNNIIDWDEYWDKVMRDTWIDEVPVYVSDEMNELIKSCKTFSYIPIGPIGDCIKSSTFRHRIPPSFLQSYILNSGEDVEEFYRLFIENNEKPPTIVVYPFKEEVIYSDVKMDPQMLSALKSENPIIANLIIDHFESDLKGRSYAHDFEATSNQLPDKSQAGGIEIIDDHRQPDQPRVTTESLGVIIEQQDKGEVSTLKRKNLRENEVQLVNKCKAIKGRQFLKMDAPGSWILEAKVGTYKLYTRSLLSLLIARAWISDEIITSYFLTVVQEHNLNSSVYVMDVAGVNRIFCGTIHGVKTFSKVDIFKYENVIGARHVNSSHWALLVLKPQAQEIIYIDPLGEKTTELQKVKRLWNSYARYQFLAGYWSRKYSWNIQAAQPHLLQKDCWSCGVYIMKFGEFILLKKPLSEFCYQQIECYRETMAISLLKNSENLEEVCRICGTHTDEDDGFWVQCDMCPKWFHSRCVQKRSKKCFSQDKCRAITFYKCLLQY